MGFLARRSEAVHSLHIRVALLAAGTMLFAMSGMPSGLAEEPAPAASLSSTVNSPADESLSVSSRIAGSHTSANVWTLTSKPKNARVNMRTAGVTSVDYVVEVTHRGRKLTRSDVGGVITVTNKGSEPRVVTVADTFVDVGCVVANGIDRSIPAASSVDFSFRCELDEDFQPRDADSHVASIMWTSGGTNHRLDTPPAEIGWDGLYVDNTVDVHDIDGDELSVLGSLMVAPDGSLQLLTPESGTLNGSTARFAYRAQLAGLPDKCSPYNTMAVVAGDEGRQVASDGSSVEVCVTSGRPGLPHTGA